MEEKLSKEKFEELRAAFPPEKMFKEMDRQRKEFKKDCLRHGLVDFDTDSVLKVVQYYMDNYNGKYIFEECNEDFFYWQIKLDEADIFEAMRHFKDFVQFPMNFGGVTGIKFENDSCEIGKCPVYRDDFVFWFEDFYNPYLPQNYFNITCPDNEVDAYSDHPFGCYVELTKEEYDKFNSLEARAAEKDSKDFIKEVSDLIDSVESRPSIKNKPIFSSPEEEKKFSN